MRTPTEAGTATFGAEAFARWRYPIAGSLGLTYSLGIFVPFTVDEFGFRDRFGQFRELFSQAPLGGRLDLALEMSL